MNGWLIRMQDDCAYIWKRKHFYRLWPIPWCLHGGTRLVITPNFNSNVINEALAYIIAEDPHAMITVTYKEEL